MLRAGIGERAQRYTQLMRRCQQLTLGILLGPLVAQADLPALSGRITDASTGRPLSGVTMMAMWVANGPGAQPPQHVGCLAVMTTTTNWLGHYSFPTSALGSHDDSPLSPSLELVTYKAGFDYRIGRLPDTADAGSVSVRPIQVNLALPPAEYGGVSVYRAQDQSGCPGSREGTTKASLPYFMAAYADAIKIVTPANEGVVVGELGAEVITAKLGLPFPSSESRIAKFLHLPDRDHLTREMVQKVIDGESIGVIAYEGLRTAVRRGDVEAVRAALNQGADSNGDDGYVKSLLWEAATNGNRASFDLLRGKGASFRAGEADALLPDVVYQGHWEILEAMAPDFHANTALGRTCIIKAASINNPQMLTALIKLGTDPNSVSDDGESVAALATKRFNPAVIDVLVSAGARLGPIPQQYNDILRDLAEQQPEALLRMLKAGAQLPKPLPGDQFNSIPRGAGSSGNLDLVRAMLERGEDKDVMLLGAASNGKDTVLSYLIERGADVKASAGDRAVFSAGVGRYVSSLELLFKAGAALEAKVPAAITNLGSAAFHGDRQVAQLLIERGDDVNVRDATGRTPLMYAAEGARTELIQYLLERGADITLKSSDGLTALMLAADGGYHEIAGPNAEPPPAPTPPVLPPATTIKLPAVTYSRGNVPRHEEQFGYNPAVQVQFQQMPVCTGSSCFPMISPPPQRPDEHPEAMRILLELGVDANAVETRDGYTALMRAVSARLPLSAKLLATKSNLGIRNHAGETAKMLADKSGVPELRDVFATARP